MIVNLYKLIEKKFKQNIEDETTLNLALDVLNQRENLEQENKKYKEVINKAIDYIDNDMYYTLDDGNTSCFVIEKVEKELLDILKEVEHE